MFEEWDDLAQVWPKKSSWRTVPLCTHEPGTRRVIGAEWWVIPEKNGLVPIEEVRLVNPTTGLNRWPVDPWLGPVAARAADRGSRDCRTVDTH